ncbi:hypothetical protein, partial [Dawidia soli]
MAANKFYPSLSALVPVEDIPDNLGFVKNGLSSVFDHFYYRNLQIDKSVAGDAAFYNLSLLTFRRIGLDIPGTGGMSLVLNPSFTETGSSEFPLSVSYKWGILKYIKGFELQTFDWSARSIFDLVSEISGVTADELLLQSIFVLTKEADDPEEPEDAIQKFVDEFNAKYTPVTPLGKGNFSDDLAVVADLIVQMSINGNAFDPVSVVFDFFIDSVEIDGDSLSKIEILFSQWLGAFSSDNIRELLIPHVSASLNNITVALEFPRTILIPLETEDDLDSDSATGPGDPLPEEFKSQVKFNVGSLRYSTDNGLEFSGESSFSFTKSQIGNTGLTIEFDNMKLDLSRKKNIPEALADGRPDDFIGVYIQEATIGLPPKLFQNNPDQGNPPEVAIKGRNLLIGTGGISGTIGLETTGSPFRAKIGKMTASLEAFDVTFKQGAITESNIFGKLLIPGFKDSAGNDAEIEIDVHIADGGDFSITAREADGIKLSIPNILAFTIKSAEIGRKDDQLYIAVSGLLEFEDQGGFLGKFLPAEIDIKKLIIWQDGSIEIEGGSLVLPTAITIKIGPAEISITGIHMGTHEQNLNGVKRKYRYFGFDGG